MQNLSGSLIIGYDFSADDNAGAVVVGKQEKGKVSIINAFQGEEAKKIFKNLTTRKEVESNADKEIT